MIWNMDRQYRFFYHYNKPYNKITIHYRGKCTIVSDIDCQVPCESKWSNTQPRLVMRGICNNVEFINTDKAIIT